MIKERGQELVKRVPSNLDSITRDPHERAKDLIDMIKSMVKDDFKGKDTKNELLKHAVRVAESLGIFDRLKVTPQEVFPELNNNN